MTRVLGDVHHCRLCEVVVTVLGEPPAVVQGPWEATVTWGGAVVE